MHPDDVSCSVEQALYTADFLMRYAKDRLGPEANRGVRGHLTASEVQLTAARALLSINPPERVSA